MIKYRISNYSVVLFCLIFFNCSYFLKEKSYKIDSNSNYIGTTTSGIFQKISQKVLLNYEFNIKSFVVNKTFIEIQTYWKKNEDFKIKNFPENNSKSRIKIILTSTTIRNKDFNFNPNLNDCYIKLTNEIYDNNQWKEIKLSNEIQKILSEITIELRNEIDNYNH